MIVVANRGFLAVWDGSAYVERAGLKSGIEECSPRCKYTGYTFTPWNSEVHAGTVDEEPAVIT